MKKGFIIGVVSIVVVLIITLMSATFISPGYAGIVYNLNGGVEKEVLTQGFHFVSPTKKVREYNISLEQGYLSKDEREGSETDDSFEVKTKDGSRLSVDLEYSYSFKLEELPKTFSTFRGQDSKTIELGFLRGKLKAYTNIVSRKYTLVELMGEKGANFNSDLLTYANQELESYGILLSTVGATRIDPVDENIKNAISSRMKKAQELEQQKLEQERVRIQMNTELEKQQKQAEITRVQADAKAYANEKLNQSISKELIELRRIEMLKEKWNGQLPKVNSGGNSILQIGQDVIQ